MTDQLLGSYRLSQQPELRREVRRIGIWLFTLAVCVVVVWWTAVVAVTGMLSRPLPRAAQHR